MSESEISPTQSPAPSQTDNLQAKMDARALLERLYREIGLSAVSAALELRERDMPVAGTPARHRGDDIAA